MGMGRRVSRRSRIGPRPVGAPFSLSCGWTVDEGRGSEATSGCSASVRLPCVLAETQEDEPHATRPDPAAGRRHASPASSPMGRRRRRRGQGRIRPFPRALGVAGRSGLSPRLHALTAVNSAGHRLIHLDLAELALSTDRADRLERENRKDRWPGSCTHAHEHLTSAPSVVGTKRRSFSLPIN